MRATASGAIEWLNDADFRLGGTLFHATVDPAVYHARVSDARGFLVVKTRGMIEDLLSHDQHLPIGTILDIGIWQGGSVALLDCAYRPRKLVGLEYSTRDLPHLDSYIASNGRQDAVRVHKGINQADVAAVTRILDTEFGGQTIDLVIDDASHVFDETMASFNVVFPRVTPGGLFVIEDWQWSTTDVHYKLDYFQGKPGLANLIVMCMLVCGARPDIVSHVTVSPTQAIVVRGPAALPKAGFSIADLARSRGEVFTAVL